MKTARMRGTVAAFTLVLGATVAAEAAIDLEWRPAASAYLIGDFVDLGLYAVSDSSVDQSISAMDVIVTWNPTRLDLVGVVNNGPYPWIGSGFPDDSAFDGLNSSLGDGDAIYQALAGLGSPAFATPGGLLVTTFRFEALAETPATPIDIPATMGSFSRTRVFDGVVPGLDVHGTLGSASVLIGIPEPSTGMIVLLAGGMLCRRRQNR